MRQCETCNGLLVDQKRAARLEKRVNKDVEELNKESESSAVVDTLDEVRCPACRNQMDKVLMEDFEFHVDECDNCDKTWFDGGELARLQLAFENREQTVELNRMRERLRNMTGEERAQYEERIANLPDRGTPIEEVAMESTSHLALFCWFRHGLFRY